MQIKIQKQANQFWDWRFLGRNRSRRRNGITCPILCWLRIIYLLHIVTIIFKFFNLTHCGGGVRRYECDAAEGIGMRSDAPAKNMHERLSAAHDLHAHQTQKRTRQPLPLRHLREKFEKCRGNISIWERLLELHVPRTPGPASCCHCLSEEVSSIIQVSSSVKYFFFRSVNGRSLAGVFLLPFNSTYAE